MPVPPQDYSPPREGGSRKGSPLKEAVDKAPVPFEDCYTTRIRFGCTEPEDKPTEMEEKSVPWWIFEATDSHYQIMVDPETLVCTDRESRHYGRSAHEVQYDANPEYVSKQKRGEIEAARAKEADLGSAARQAVRQAVRESLMDNLEPMLKEEIREQAEEAVREETGMDGFGN